MADVKDGDIVFEYPDDDEIPGAQATEEKEVETNKAQSNNEVKIEAKVQDELDLEIEDDTPPEDRNRDPLPKEVIEEVENDDLTSYSDKVKTRLSQLRKMHHDERRAKEAADRERQEAIRFAQQLAEENKKLKTTLSSGEATYIQTLKESLENELSIAKRDYGEAYDSGDRDKIIEAQSKMNDTQLRLAQANNYVTQFKTPYKSLKKMYIYNKINNQFQNLILKR
jgi:hypothetical protein